jgi:hypothetical protein
MTDYFIYHCVISENNFVRKLLIIDWLVNTIQRKTFFCDFACSNLMTFVDNIIISKKKLSSSNAFAGVAKSCVYRAGILANGRLTGWWIPSHISTHHRHCLSSCLYREYERGGGDPSLPPPPLGENMGCWPPITNSYNMYANNSLSILLTHMDVLLFWVRRVNWKSQHYEIYPLAAADFYEE